MMLGGCVAPADEDPYTGELVREYETTSADISWPTGSGGPFLYFDKQGANVSARWIDSQKLEVTIEKGIEFRKRDDWAFFSGDKVDIIYREI